ncbi:MAG: hypothetical protein EOO77_44195 [Oxalobacteraceae bacterium]|nr:MAG: hypothetical protein EOO77_44195 [Oxalobacteraceae bacterium]
MIASMTGFARREGIVSSASLVCEIRSVNHRFLEAGVRLPDELRALEGELRSRLQKDLKRGKVDCTLSLRGAAGGVSKQLELDSAIVQIPTQLLHLSTTPCDVTTISVEALTLIMKHRPPGHSICASSA